jgi:hypothetical protein
MGAVFLVLLLAGCELAPPPGGGAGLAVLLPGAPGGPSRAVDVTGPGSIGDDAVQRLLTYELSLSGPNGQTVKRAAAYGQTMNFDLAPGVWTITTNAFFRGNGNLQANDPASSAAGPKTVTLTPGMTQSVPVTLELHPDLKEMILIPDEATFKKIGEPAPGGWLGEEKKFLLLTDLMLTNWKGPKIAGASPTEWAVFEGGGHTITINSFMSGAGNYGLFMDAYQAEISGLNIVLNIPDGPDDTVLAGGLTAGGSVVGIVDVHVSGKLYVSTTGPSTDSYAGGIAGELTGGSIVLCSSKLDLKLVNSTDNSVVGGLVGEIDAISTNASLIMESFFNGIVEGKIVGGIIGRQAVSNSDTIDIKHCYSAGTVQGPGNATYAGGIAGYLPDTPPSPVNIVGCYVTGTVDISTATYGSAGGIAGTADGNGHSIVNCIVLNSEVRGGSSVHRIVDGPSLGPTGLSSNSVYGSTFYQGVSSITPTADPGGGGNEGADLPSVADPPGPDFSGTEFDTTQPLSVFAPSVWPYHPYPVLSWQIEKGIQP